MPGAAEYGSPLYEFRDVTCRVYWPLWNWGHNKIFDPWGHSKVISRISEEIAKSSISSIVDLAGTRALLFVASGCSGRLPEAPWAPMVAPGSSCQKSVEMFLLSKTLILHYSGLLLTSPMTCVLDHWKFKETIVLSTSGSNARGSSHRTSWR